MVTFSIETIFFCCPVILIWGCWFICGSWYPKMSLYEHVVWIFLIGVYWNFKGLASVTYESFIVNFCSVLFSLPIIGIILIDTIPLNKSSEITTDVEGTLNYIILVLRLVPDQDGLFALILWYVAKSIFRS